MKLPANKRYIPATATTRARIVEQISPKLDASAKIRAQKSKRARVVSRAKISLTNS